MFMVAETLAQRMPNVSVLAGFSALIFKTLQPFSSQFLSTNDHVFGISFIFLAAISDNLSGDISTKRGSGKHGTR